MGAPNKLVLDDMDLFQVIRRSSGGLLTSIGSHGPVGGREELIAQGLFRTGGVGRRRRVEALIGGKEFALELGERSAKEALQEIARRWQSGRSG